MVVLCSFRKKANPSKKRHRLCKGKYSYIHVNMYVYKYIYIYVHSDVLYLKICLLKRLIYKYYTNYSIIFCLCYIIYVTIVKRSLRGSVERACYLRT